MLSQAHTALLPRVEQTSKRPRALSPEQVVELRYAYRDGDSTATLAARYGISRNTAHKVAIGQTYADVPTPERLPLVPPTVRYRGTHNDEECRQMGRMLRHNPGKWVKVKECRTKPDASRYEGYGMESSIIRIGHDMWGLFVRWSTTPKLITVLAG